MNVDADLKVSRFTASPESLTGETRLFGQAEQAREVRRAASAVVSVVVATNDSVRRFDCWCDETRFVGQAFAASPGRVITGVIAPLTVLYGLVCSALTDLVGAVPATAAAAPLELPALAEMVPEVCRPGELQWLATVSFVGGAGVSHWATASTGTGLVGGSFEHVDQPLVLEPLGQSAMWRGIEDLVAAAL